MTDQHEDTGNSPDTPCEHCGIFTLGGDIPIQGAWRDITYAPVRDSIWSVSEGIYRSIFLKGKKSMVYGSIHLFNTVGMGEYGRPLAAYEST